MDFLKINNRVAHLMKSYTSADYDYRTVLTNSSFDYVELWLKSGRIAAKKKDEALMFWRQAKSLYEAAKFVTIESKPLLLYYCCLNAAKTYLAIKGVATDNISHGVGSSRTTTTGNIRTDKVQFTGSGVLFELSKKLGDKAVSSDYLLIDLLYNLLCVHRTFIITYSDFSDLFVPVDSLWFGNVKKTQKYYLQFYIDCKYANGYVKPYIPKEFEEHHGDTSERLCYRSKKRFDWDIHSPKATRLAELGRYHAKYRRYFHYISGKTTLWYLKKNLPRNKHIIDRSQATLIYGVMHWLSELARYQPMVFDSLLNTRSNWLIREFLDIAPTQFVDEICSEITGANILPPGWRL